MAEDKADVAGGRVTFNLTKRGEWALNSVCSYTGEGKTDAINDSLRLYAMVLGAGPDVQLYIKPRDAQLERIHLP
jgi:hypothetical protein